MPKASRAPDYRTLVDNLQDVVFQIGRDGTWTLLNPAWTALTGRPVADTLGHPFEDSLHPDDRAPARSVFDLLIGGQSDSYRMDLRCLTQDGGHCWVQVYARVERSPAGRVRGVCGTLSDIGARRRLHDTVMSIAEGVSAKLGGEFFNSMVMQLSKVLGVTYATVGRLVAPGRVRTLAVVANGEQVDNLEYDLAGTPCEQVFATGFCFYGENVQALFPQDGYLAQWGVHSYAGYPLISSDGSTIGIISVLHTERMRDAEFCQTVMQIFRARAAAELERVASESGLRLAAGVFENSSEAIAITDADYNIVSVNRAFADITGYSGEEVHGYNLGSVRAASEAAEGMSVWEHVRAEGSWKGEVWSKRKNGETYVEWLSVQAVRDARGEITHYIAMFLDISERKAADERIRYLAHYDALTGLPNRMLLIDRIHSAAARARRADTRLALLLLDLDRFKNVNDSLGHDSGDALLQAVATRIRGCLRESDTVARLGGDEFAVLLTDLNDIAQPAYVAQTLITSIGRPYLIQDHDLVMTPSIGISIYPDDGPEPEDLLRNADVAMYHAKQTGRNSAQFFTEDMNSRAYELLALESGLRRALDNEEFILHFQPQVDVRSGRIVGAEALIRWQHPEHGMVPPARFIPVAEESSLIVAIGEWVIRAATEQARRWRDAGLPPLPVAVNISALQFRHGGFESEVNRALKDAGLGMDALEMELTESIIMEDAHGASDVLRSLRSRGLRVSIDDFGTGYSSLSYLKRLPIDKLKIDRSFVSEIHHDKDSAAITRTIIQMARSLNLGVIAEGVEGREQLSFLRAERCDQMQGYYFSRPLAADAFADLVMRFEKLRGH